MKRILWLALVFALALLQGCATVFQGENRNIQFQSQPHGVDVYVNGVYCGQTPLLLQLKAGTNYAVEYRMAGFRTEVRQIRNRVSAKWVVLDVICGVYSVVIDALTGAWYEFDNNYISASMERLTDD